MSKSGPVLGERRAAAPAALQQQAGLQISDLCAAGRRLVELAACAALCSTAAPGLQQHTGSLTTWGFGMSQVSGSSCCCC